MALRLSAEYKEEFLKVWNSSGSVDEFLIKFPKSLSRRTALVIASYLRVNGDEAKYMARGPKSTAPNMKDGRTLKGKGRRLGWISEAMHQRIAAYAERYGYKTVNDAVMVLIDQSLTEDEEGINPPPGILENWEVEKETP